MRNSFFILQVMPYLSIVFTWAYLYFSKVKNRHLCFFILLTLFSALRYEVGWDFPEYVWISSQSPSYIFGERYELGATIIFILSSLLGSYSWTFILFGFLTNYFVYKSIKYNTREKMVSGLVYFSFPTFFLGSFSTIRFSLALAIIFFAFSLVVERRYVRFIFFVLIATQFHIAALFALLYIPLSRLSLKQSGLFFLVLTSFLVREYSYSILTLANLDVGIFMKFINFYVNVENRSSTFFLYFMTSLVLFSLIFMKQLVNVNQSNQSRLLFVSFSIVVFNIFSFEPVSAMRFSTLLFLPIIFIFSDLYILFNRKRFYVFSIFLLFFFILLPFFYIYSYYTAFNKGELEKIGFLPYRTWILN